jgi:hypothetical protein
MSILYEELMLDCQAAASLFLAVGQIITGLASFRDYKVDICLFFISNLLKILVLEFVLKHYFKTVYACQLKPNKQNFQSDLKSF